MKYFFFRLNPPRPSFPADITPAETVLMQKHVSYWSNLMVQGKVVAFGPVADPSGRYGIGIMQLDDDAEPRVLGDNDPVIQANAGFSIEVHPMPKIIISPRCA